MSIDNFSVVDWYIFPIIIFFLNTLAMNYYSIKNENGYLYKRANITLSLISTIFIIILSATRTAIGDTSNYINIFKISPETFSDFLTATDWSGEWGFEFINFFIKSKITDDPTTYLFILSLITIGLIFITFYKYSQYFELCVLIFILSGSYITSLNGIRQSLVAAIFFFFFKLIPEKKYIKYFLLCIILSTIHRSALVLSPLIFIFNMEPWGKGTKILCVIGLIMYIFYPITSKIFAFFISDTNYSIYGTGILTGSSGSANFVRVLVALVPIVLSYFYRKKLCNLQYFNVFLHATILNFIFMLLASAASWIFARFCIYFSMFSFVLLCWEILISGKNKKIFYFSCIFLYFVFYYFEIRVLV